MNPRILFLLLVLLLVSILTLVGIAWFASPRLVSFSPSDGAEQVPPGSPLRLTFSRAMRPETVISRLSMEPPHSGEFAWEGNTLIFTPDRPWPGGTRITAKLQAGGRAAAFPGLPVWNSQSWSFTTGQTLLAYLWPSYGPADVYALDALSGDVRQLTDVKSVLDYSFNAAGDLLVFSAGNIQGGSDLFQLKLNFFGEPNTSIRQPERLLDCGADSCRFPKISPNGSLLAFERAPLGTTGNAQITHVWLIPLPTGEPRLAGEPAHYTIGPSWSASGKIAFYDRDRSAFTVLDPNSHEIVFLPNQRGDPGSWSPDGEYFVVAEVVTESAGLPEPRATSHLMRFDLISGMGPTVFLAGDLTQDIFQEDASPVFSPDSKTIAFARKYLDRARWTPGRQLWLMDADGNNARQLTDNPHFNHYDFAWSADSLSLAFVRYNQMILTDPPELWLIDVQGSQPIQLVIGGYAPQWIP